MERKVELTDLPTGLATRAAFDHLYEFAFSLAKRGVPPTLLFLASDPGSGERSETLSDELGHGLKLVTRKTDVVARYEDDEFVCLLVDCNASGALIAADRIRSALDDILPSGVTLSAGVATWRESMENPDELVVEARRALTEAREAGGDRTELASPT